MEAFETYGLWWLPDHSDKRVAGKLTFDPHEGCSLELTDMLFTERDFGGKPFANGVILGGTSKSIYTLHHATETFFEIGGGFGFARQKFSIRHIYEGILAQSVDDLKFANILLHYPRIEEWIGANVFDDDSCDDDNRLLAKLSHSYCSPSTIQFPSEHCSVNFRFRHRVARETDVRSIFHQSLIELRPTEMLSFDDYLQGHFYAIHNLFTLLFGQIIEPTCILSETTDSSEDDLRDFCINNIEVYTSLGRLRKASNSIDACEFRFSFSDLKSAFGNILSLWFQSAQEIRAVHDLYFAALSSSGMYLEHRFLMLCQAIEALSQDRCSGTLMDASSFSKIVAAMTEVIPSATPNRQRLIDKLPSLNYRSNDQKIFDLLQPLSPMLKDLGIMNVDLFLEKAVPLRNKLTHRNTKKSPASSKYTELYLIAEQMKYTLEVLLFLEVGITQDLIAPALQKSPRLRFFRSSLRKHSLV